MRTLNWKSTVMWTAPSLLFLLVALVVGPAPALADGSHSGKDVVLYELTEEAQFTATGHRLATSGLEGKAKRGTPLCPEGLMAYAEAFFLQVAGIHVKDTSRCTVVAVGHSDIDLSTFGGTITGDIAVVVNSDKTNLMDAPELVIMTATFNASIQVSDPDGVIITVLPGATLTATTILPGFPGGLPTPATFTGKFRLPFKFHHKAVYKKDNGHIVPVLPNERALGDPTVRLEVTFDD